MTHAESLHSLEDLGAGDHLCCIYETEEDHRATLTPFLRQGLERDEKVLYVVDDRTAEVILDYLRDSGLDVQPYLDKGQLNILTRDEAYVRGGTFDPDAMIALLERETEQALAEGYTALRVTGEMSWALRGLPGSERLIEYEAKLNQFFPDRQCLAICQYDRRRFEPQVLLDVLRTHPIAVIGTEVYDNLYYIPPDELMGAEPKESELRHWIRNLAERQRTVDALRESRERYRSFFHTSMDAVFITSRAGRWIDMNAAAVELFGYESKEELQEVAIPDLYACPAEREGHIRAIEEQGFTKNYAINLRRKDGSVINALITSVPVKDDEGNVTGFRGTIRDITARKRAEEALRESERILNTTGKIGKIGGWEHDLTTGEAVWTQALHDIIDIPYDQEPPGVDEHLSYYPPLEREILEQAYNQAVEDGTPFDLELQVYTAQRELIWCRAQGKPVYEDGECVAMRGTFQDITKRKQLTDMLRKERDLLKTVMDTSPVCITVVDREGQIVFANDRAEEILGPAKETITSHTYDDPTWRITDYDGGHFPSEQLPFRQVMRTGKSVHNVQHAIEWPNGRRVLLSIDGAPLFDASGALEWVVFAIEDVTKQVQIAEALRESEERYRTLFERLPVGVFRSTPDGRFVDANPAHVQLLGCPDLETLLATPVADFYMVPEQRRKWKAVTEREGINQVWEALWQRLDGNPIWVQEYARAIRDAEGRVVYYDGIVVDITERKRAEETLKGYSERLEEMVEERTQELREAQERLVRREKLAMLGQLASSVGHELRNPLGAIKNAAYFLDMMLREGEPDPAVKETLEILEREIDRSETIIRSLLNFARTKVPERQPLSVNDIVEEVISRTSVPKDVETVLQLDDALPTILADPDQLAQVFGNLIRNALQAMPPPLTGGGRLTIKTEAEERWLTVSISDTGEGIAEENLEKIFEPLFSTKDEGVGLGLALSRSIVEAHGGTIEVESTVGACSTFTVKLPVE